MTGASPFQRALETLVRPLEFAASRDANRERVQNLEEHVRRQVELLRAMAIPDDAREQLAALAVQFEQGASDATVRRGRELVRALAAPEYAEKALLRSLSSLRGLGDKRAEILKKRDLRTVEDLLFLFPQRYDDRRVRVQVGELEVGQRSTFEAEVLVSGEATHRGRRGQRLVEAVVGDDSGTINLKWFRGFDSLLRMLRKGTRLRVTGDVKRYRFSKEIVHPEIEVLGAEDRPSDGDVLPEYPAIQGIPPRTLRGAIRTALTQYADLIPTYAPSGEGAPPLPEVPDALRLLHDPSADVEIEALREHSHVAHQRLVLEELYLLEVGLALRKQGGHRVPALPIAAEGERLERARRSLPFALTGAQDRAWREIRRDLARAHPMHRLLQGDVGSGKTAVAYLAALASAASGHQTALMAPTELLAEQHARTLEKLAQNEPEVGLRLALLTSSRPKAEAEAIRTGLASGAVECVVGTQALLEPGVHFRSLALAVIDEQHRFGVKQRAALAAKCPGERMPHTLVMTATPIPRTLSLTLYGDLDISVIDELPPGRAPVETHLLRSGEGPRVMEHIRDALGRGEQVYVIYPLVEASEAIDLRAATEQAERIRRALPEHRVALVHGRQDGAERAATMAAFEAGEVSLLVSTTVVEVGVDVPGATLMVIEHAERFGLAQLHQLRGRVGRGNRPGTCLLIARGSTEDSEARLRALLETTDGFAIADADLRIRGPGEFLGTRQHGHLPGLRMADLLRDTRLLAQARRLAFDAVAKDPTLRRQPSLARAVARRWGDRLALADVG
jgi:ATP-dependent DNA helicase RecG